MSLAEVQQLYNILVEIDAILKGVTVKTAEIEQKQPKMDEALSTFRDLERLALRWLVLARRIGLPEDFNSVVTFISKVVVTMRMAQMSLSMMMASNPVTAAIGIAGLLGVAVQLGSGSIMEGY